MGEIVLAEAGVLGPTLKGALGRLAVAGVISGALNGCGTSAILGTPCAVSETCGRVAICEWPSGTFRSAASSGRCLSLPAICTAIYQPVCGCDGKTYGNDCARQHARVRKAHDGPCSKSSMRHFPIRLRQFLASIAGEAGKGTTHFS